MLDSHTTNDVPEDNQYVQEQEGQVSQWAMCKLLLVYRMGNTPGKIIIQLDDDDNSGGLNAM